jgi:MFS family permease
MRFTKLFSPKPTISKQDVSTGLRLVPLEGIASQGFFSITTSGFLTAFALTLGANNLQIGILAAIPFLTQPLQIPSILMVERLRRRKSIATFFYLGAQLLWIPIALIPVFMEVPGGGAVSLLLGLMAVRSAVTAVSTCAWNSWLKDLIPQKVLGRVMGSRLAFAGIAAMFFGLGAAFFVDYWIRHTSPDHEPLGYTYVLLFGIFTLAMASPIIMSLIPEPLMAPSPKPRPPLTATVGAPFSDQNYRKLLRFLFLWGLAINLATPFFAVYMLQRLGMPLSAVIGFSVLSQIFNVLFLRVWGRMADQYGSKAILSLCVSLYLLVILGWVFTTMPEKYFLTIPLLVLLHVMAGIASAGVTLAIGTVGMKLAPQGQATAYLAGAGLATSMGAGVGPLLGGIFADFFSTRQLSMTLEWIDPSRTINIGALYLTGFDFLFGIAFVIGLATLVLLGAIREEGEVSREIVLESLFAPIRSMSRPFSTVAGLGFLGQFPYGYLRRMPLPGIDVALGVTAYQIAGMAKAAAISVAEGKRAMDKLAKPLEDALSVLWRDSEPVAAHGLEVAQQAARGAMHATDSIPQSSGQAAHDVMLAVVGSLAKSHVDPRSSIRGTAFGIVLGAVEARLDIVEVAQQALDAAAEAARQTGLSAETAETEAAAGIMEAAVAAGPEAVTKVKAILPNQ